MTGWLIYSREGAKRNRAFIDFWKNAASERGVSIRLMYTDDPLPTENPDFAVVRDMNPAYSKMLEDRGIRVFNPSSVSEICNDKWNTYCLAEKLGVPFPTTEYIPDPSDMKAHPYPYVLKSCTGHGGTQVFMVRNNEEARVASASLAGIPSVLQTPVSDLGKDLRIYVLGKKVIASMLRISKTDFRSNFCLGGSAIPYQLTAHEQSIVDAFSDALPFGLVGIDLIFDHGKAVFNEIEDVVGCRMLYGLTDVKPVELYLSYILDRLN
ncbi:MAG: ATP-grasp domain-containing protein [Clostridia bacterium]|nr:ATP-grasp domain-containing protein [Clostridia bacterium]